MSEQNFTAKINQVPSHKNKVVILVNSIVCVSNSGVHCHSAPIFFLFSVNIITKTKPSKNNCDSQKISLQTRCHVAICFMGDKHDGYGLIGHADGICYEQHVVFCLECAHHSLLFHHIFLSNVKLNTLFAIYQK